MSTSGRLMFFRPLADQADAGVNCVWRSKEAQAVGNQYVVVVFDLLVGAPGMIWNMSLSGVIGGVGTRRRSAPVRRFSFKTY